MAVFVVLLRAIGPMTHAIMSMAAWRAASEAAGFRDPQTYVATGNMIFGSDLSPAGVERAMDSIVATLGLGDGNKAIVRRPQALQSILRANPFPQAAEERPGQVGVYFFARKPDFGWVGDHEGPERIHVEGRHLVVDYGPDTGRSPRLPALIERRSGIVTARHWNTVRGLAGRCAARQAKGR